MNDQYIYFVVVNDNKDLLKEEIKIFFKFLSLSFSKGQFITYKNTGKRLSAEQIKKLDITFALDWGESINPITDEFINTKLALTIIPELPKDAPSRAYLKIMQALEIFPIEDKNTNWIEFGSSPGGASLYLLNNYNKLIGVDPAEMDEVCLNNSKFVHMQKPIQNIEIKDFSFQDITCIASDLNLNPKQAIQEVLRISKFFKNVKNIFMTVKMVKTNHVKLISQFTKMFHDQKFKTKKIQLSSHRREFLIIAYK